MDNDGSNIPPSAFRHLPSPPPRRRCTNGGDSNRFSKEGNSSINCSIDCLPIELLFDILLLLPADFLYGKARLVCRKWHEIIRSDDFINAQIRRSSYGLLLSLRSDTHHVYVTAIQGRIQAQALMKPPRAETLSTCNGLVLEYIHPDNGEGPSLLVTNPATKQQFPLPPLPINWDERFDFRVIGIAYSAASMAYKLTLPYYADPCGLPSLPQCIHLRILTAGVDKSWRNLEIGHLTDDVRSFLCGLHPLTTEGFLHWVRDGEEVLSLNVETETFTFTKIPKKCWDPYFYCTTLSAGRCLSILCAREEYFWEIWEMKPKESDDDDDDDRWRNLLPMKIDLRSHKCLLRKFAQHNEFLLPRVEYLLAEGQHNEFLMPVGWVKYPQILALRYLDVGNTCIFYNLDTHEIDRIALPECLGPCYWAHKSSLVRKF